MSELKVNDLIDYPEAKFVEAKEIIDICHEITTRYISMDNLYDADGLEELKRELTAQLELFASHFATVKRFKTKGDYLEELRKQVKAEAIIKLTEEEGISINQAEKVVYASEYYTNRIKLMESLKSWFIKIDTLYINYKDMLNSIIQSISLVRKDPNYRPADNE